jgi:hypothetical protein
MVRPLSWPVEASKAQLQRATRKVEMLKAWLDGDEWYYQWVRLASGIRDIAENSSV